MFPAATASADQFLSTPSGWRATGEWMLETEGQPISIHALRVEGDIDAHCVALRNRISIHALRVEGDLGHFCKNPLTIRISIHALRVEGDKNQFKRRKSK